MFRITMCSCAHCSCRPSMPPSIPDPQLSFRYWTVKGKRNVTGEGPGTLWLRRVGGHQAGPHALPYQHQDAIRGFLWLWHSNPDDSVTFIKPCLYVHLPVSYDWRPRLRLVVMSESGDGFDTVEAVVHYEASEDPQWSELYTWRNIRPISFTFKLPPGAGNCFKVRKQVLTVLWLHGMQSEAVGQYAQLDWRAARCAVHAADITVTLARLAGARTCPCAVRYQQT